MSDNLSESKSVDILLYLISHADVQCPSLLLLLVQFQLGVLQGLTLPQYSLVLLLSLADNVGGGNALKTIDGVNLVVDRLFSVDLVNLAVQVLDGVL